MPFRDECGVFGLSPRAEGGRQACLNGNLTNRETLRICTTGGDRRVTALVIAHPGHELRVYGWVAQTLPRVYVMTNGSGGSGQPRLASTERLLASLGVVRYEAVAVYSDKQLYELVMRADPAPFIAMAESLAQSFAEGDVEVVAGDATEGFNPSHDLCRALVNAAVALASHRTGRAIANYEFSLTEWDLEGIAFHDSRCIHHRLDDDLLRRKLEAATAYGELRGEVELALQKRGGEYFRVECMRSAQEFGPPVAPSERPYYEEVGEARVRQGIYDQVLRFADHISPVLAGLHVYTKCVADGMTIAKALASCDSPENKSGSLARTASVMAR